MSFRKCPQCAGKAGVTDSRQFDEHVRRRYVCPCGHRYSTAEFIVAEGSHPGRHIVREFKTEMARAGGAAVRAQLRALLAEQPGSEPGGR